MLSASFLSQQIYNFQCLFEAQQGFSKMIRSVFRNVFENGQMTLLVLKYSKTAMLNCCKLTWIFVKRLLAKFESETSPQTCMCLFPYSFVKNSQTSFKPSLFRSTRTTLAPSLANFLEIAEPIPPAAPRRMKNIVVVVLRIYLPVTGQH